MNKLIYWIGLPICFVILCGISFLLPKTYQSVFVIAQEREDAPRGYQSLTLHDPAQYDLGILRSLNELGKEAYSTIISSDAFLAGLLDMPIRTLDGSFDGSYSDYCLLNKISKDSKMPTVRAKNEYVHWSSTQQEQIKSKLFKSIKVEVDHAAELVTITCKAHDPLVATMMANHVQNHLRSQIEKNQLDKKQQILNQLSAVTAQAKADYEQDPTKEKEAIYKSFAKQEVVYKAQMSYSSAFVVLAEPSFSYKKEGPSHVKIPMLLTLLIGLCVCAVDKRREIVAFFHED